MKKMFARILSLVAIIVISHLCPIDGDAKVRIACEKDSVMAEKIMKAVDKDADYGKRIVAIAEMLDGTPWAAAPDNDTIGTVVVSLHGFDRMGFVNNVMALAMASVKSQPTMKDYADALVNISRRKGVDDGFTSQMLYVSDWIVDNVYRGNIKEMTEYMTGGGTRTKTLDYVTRHKEEYPALSNPETLDRMKMIEMGYRSHRIPHLKKQSAGNKPIHELMQSGDIIIMSALEDDYDLYDIGFIEMKDGEPYLIHISHETGKVVKDPYPLARLFKLEGQHFYGYRWLRPTE